MADVRLEGGDELLRKLRLLEGAVRGAALKDAAQGGADIVRDRAAQLAPRGRTGKLAARMETEVVRSEPDHAEVAIGPTAFHGLFQELGTPHQPAQPFLRPALDGTEGAVVAKVGAKLRRRVLEVAGRGS